MINVSVGSVGVGSVGSVVGPGAWWGECSGNRAFSSHDLL